MTNMPRRTGDSRKPQWLKGLRNIDAGVAGHRLGTALAPPGSMLRVLTGFCFLVLLGGCYNPRYPSETPGAEPLPHETGSSQETSAGDRRNAAAASGSSVTRE